MYAEFLRNDFDIVEAADGLAALEAIKSQVPDVVITDLALPRMDGFELVARMRADQRTAHVPVIALSGYSGQDLEARVRAAGTTIVLEKPCLPDTLIGALQTVLRPADEAL